MKLEWARCTQCGRKIGLFQLGMTAQVKCSHCRTINDVRLHPERRERDPAKA